MYLYTVNLFSEYVRLSVQSVMCIQTVCRFLHPLTLVVMDTSGKSSCPCWGTLPRVGSSKV